MPYLKKAGGALHTILQNPIAFAGHLVAAAKLGFQQFAANFGTHLKTSLVGWLTGALSGAGIYIPQALSLAEIGKFVLSVLGITWTKIRAMIVKALGPTGETIMKAMETGFDVVVALVKGGPAAAWEVIKDKLGDLKDMVLSAILGFVEEKVVKAAVTKLLSLLSPVGAFIQAIIGIYNTVMFFVERLKQIAAVVAAFIDSIAAIASGAIGAAAARVESTLSGLLTLVISFLARIAGLGGVTDFIVAKIKALQERVEKALETAVQWIVGKANAFFLNLGHSTAGAVAAWWRARKSLTIDDESHELSVAGAPGSAQIMMASKAPGSLRAMLEGQPSSPAIVRALQVVTELEKLIRLQASKSLKDDEAATIKAAIQTKLEVLTGILPSIFGGLLESTAPQFGGLTSHGYATSMLVLRLTKKGPPGSTPSVSNENFDILNLRRNKDGSYYVFGSSSQSFTAWSWKYVEQSYTAFPKRERSTLDTGGTAGQKKSP